MNKKITYIILMSLFINQVNLLNGFWGQEHLTRNKGKYLILAAAVVLLIMKIKTPKSSKKLDTKDSTQHPKIGHAYMLDTGWFFYLGNNEWKPVGDSV